MQRFGYDFFPGKKKLKTCKEHPVELGIGLQRLGITGTVFKNGAMNDDEDEERGGWIT